MGLKCSLLGHSFEPAGVEREREQQGSEVVTVARELERCTRCDAERVVSESTEVTAVVDADEVDLEDRHGPGAAGSRTGGGQTGGGIGGADRAGAVDEGPARETDGIDLEDRDPEEEDAEILTDEEPERQPGQWPDEPVGGDPTPHYGPPGEDAADTGAESGDTGVDDPGADEGGGTEAGGTEAGPHDGGTSGGPASRNASAGIAGGDGEIVCQDCSFAVDADSGYRDGDPCPECGAWLTVE